MKPGEIIPGEGAIHINQTGEVATITVENTSDHSVQITSHYHFFEANKLLRFDRRAAYGRRLDIAAGDSVRWAPGEFKEVRLVSLAGRRRVYGFQGLVNGQLTDEHMGRALIRARKLGFLMEES